MGLGWGRGRVGNGVGRVRDAERMGGVRSHADGGTKWRRMTDVETRDGADAETPHSTRAHTHTNTSSSVVYMLTPRCVTQEGNVTSRCEWEKIHVFFNERHFS